MKKLSRLPILIGGFLAVGALAAWLSCFAPRSYANVTLVSFSATSLQGLPEIWVEWETATQFETVGFYIVRSDTSTGPYTRVSDFIQRAGDDLTGAQYQWLDDRTELDQTYWYKLEEITTSQESIFYGPVGVIAGAEATVPPPTNTPTVTPTPTLTPTRTPTASNTPKATTPPKSDATASSSGAIATPVPVTGATVTPRPSSSNSPGAQIVLATPQASQPVTAQQSSGLVPQPTPAPSKAESAPAETSVAPVPVVIHAAPVQSAAVPTNAAPTFSAPVVVATETVPEPAQPASSSGASALLLIGAAFLFLGLAFFILRQVRS